MFISEYYKKYNIWDLQNNGTSIPYRAFRYCDNLVSITIPEGVLSIGESGFQGVTI